jgi:hypothetical protein
MEDHEKGLTAPDHKPDQPRNEGQTEIQEQGQKKIVDYENALKDLNSKIMSITLAISDQYPELSAFLEEMPATIPNEDNPEMTLSHLLAYYESLNSILNNYKLEHPATEVSGNDVSK